MNQNVYNKIALMLKILAMLVGAFLILWGFIGGVLGYDPGGKIEYIETRLVALFTMFLGIIYLIPNAKIRKSNRLMIIYMAVTLLPSLIFIIASLYTIFAEGMNSYIYSGGLLTVAVSVPLSLAAPLSLIFSVLATRKGLSNSP